jgi:hypothetical protein
MRLQGGQEVWIPKLRPKVEARPTDCPARPGFGGGFLIHLSRWCSFGKTHRHIAFCT